MRIVVVLVLLGLFTGCSQKQIDAMNRSYEKANASGVPNTTYRNTLKNTQRSRPASTPQTVPNTQQGTWGMQPQPQKVQNCYRTGDLVHCR